MDNLINFFYKHKRVLTAAGLMLAVIILGWLIYSSFFKPAIMPSGGGQAPAGTDGQAGGGQLPPSQTGSGRVVETGGDGQLEPAGGDADAAETASQIADGGTTKTEEIIQTPTLGAELAQNGSDVQYYNKDDGKFYRVDQNGNISALSDKVFHGVEQITWAPSMDKAILEYPDGSNIIYDFNANKQITLPKHWEDFNFSPDGNEIVMKSLGLDPANRWLAITNADGTKAMPIEAIGNNDKTVYPSWSPNNQSIAMYTKGVDFNRQEVFFVGLHDENFKSTVVEGRGFTPEWSPAGDKLLYSVYSSDTDNKPLLWIVNASGEQIGSGRKSLKLETWANKCAFTDNATVYCAVPEDLPAGAGIFREMTQGSKDDLYEVNIETGQKRLVAVPDGNYSISNPSVSEDGKYLYFTDGISGTLNKIRLK